MILWQGRTEEDGPNLEENPPEENCIKSGILHRKLHSSKGAAWSARLVTITARDVCFSKPSADGAKAVMLDYVPLHEIDSIQQNPSRKNGLSVEENEEDESLTFVIHTIEDGHNSGRVTILKAASQEDYEEWVSTIQRCVKMAIQQEMAKVDAGLLARERRLARQFYTSDPVQYCIAFVIIMTYFVALSESQLLPAKASRTASTFRALETLFTTIFACELVINLFGNWFVPFWLDR